MKGPPTLESLPDRINDAVQDLLKMARDLSFNRISDNLFFIISKPEAEYEPSANFYEKNKLRKKLNDAKPAMTFDAAVDWLRQHFDSIYEINLIVYRAEKKKTTIEICIREKNGVDRETPSYLPMLISKVGIPPYADNSISWNGYNSHPVRKKFDINWELNPWNHRWKLYWNYQKFKLEMWRQERRKRKAAV